MMEHRKVKSTDIDAHIHPDFKDFIKTFPAEALVVTKETLPEVRKSMSSKRDAVPPKLSDNVTTAKINIQGPKNAPDVLVYVSQPKKREGLLPAILWIHGGGFVLGSAASTDQWCHRLVDEVGCVAVSVDYRLAPEHPFPAAIEDCYAALVWMKESATELGIDVNRIAISGQSAGGGLTASLSLLARDRGGPAICFQMPLYPMIDDRNVTPSSHEIIDTRVWNRGSNIEAWKMYLGDDVTKEISPYAAPIRATDFSGLPPTYTFVGQLDPFRDENIEYVTKLMQAGVPVEFHIYPGCFHGFESFLPNSELSQQVVAAKVDAFKKALALKN